MMGPSIRRIDEWGSLIDYTGSSTVYMVVIRRWRHVVPSDGFGVKRLRKPKSYDPSGLLLGKVRHTNSRQCWRLIWHPLTQQELCLEESNRGCDVLGLRL